jgi:hypothetical protein
MNLILINPIAFMFCNCTQDERSASAEVHSSSNRFITSLIFEDKTETEIVTEQRREFNAHDCGQEKAATKNENNIILAGSYCAWVLPLLVNYMI